MYIPVWEPRVYNIWTYLQPLKSQYSTHAGQALLQPPTYLFIDARNVFSIIFTISSLGHYEPVFLS